MKKLFFCVATVFIFLGNAKAQYVFDKGDVAVNAVLGFAGRDGFIPSIEFSGEYGAIPTGSIGVVSFGGKIGYKYSSNGVNGVGINPGYDYNYSQFDIGARAAWHLLYFENTKWDVFAGLGVGLNYRSGYSYDYSAFGITNSEKVKGSSHLYSSGFVGGRMMLSDNFGLYGEVGYSRMSTVRIGLTFKL